jgi:FKBP-type peptidyl-prolyl cis-trans isomerase
MKKPAFRFLTWLGFGLVGCTTVPYSFGQTASGDVNPSPPLSPEEESYLIGLSIGEQMHFSGFTDPKQVNFDIVDRGLRDGLGGKRLSVAERAQVQRSVEYSIEALRARNKAIAAEFMSKNRLAKGVQTTASGLQYKVLATGEPQAAIVKPTDEVLVNCRIQLLDGTEFYSTYDGGKPVFIGLNELVKGAQEGVLLMRPGDKWELYVPPELGFGAEQRPRIPANSVLIYDVEVVGAKPGATAAATKPDVAQVPR